MRLLLAILFLGTILNGGFAQTEMLSNWRMRNLSYSAEGQRIDSLTIIPHTLQVWQQQGQEQIKLDNSTYQIKNDSIFFTQTSTIQNIDSQQFILRYRVLPFDLSATYNHLDSTKAKFTEDDGLIRIDYDPYAKESQILEVDGLNYNGSFARGISFGNNQNLVLNSSFNLQLAGNIGDDIEVLAAITDENIPLQPEGNTQQLQEFDKIFIQLKRGGNQLTAGDYELRRPNSYFLNYYKKLQGATLSNISPLGEKASLKSQGSVAISRGKFARNMVQALEGNQGPYKLRGSSGERFIIALAGTEKVFLDGQLLTRGLERDYTIDYNRSEVTFTNKRLITKDSRIIIEFEYADQNFTRSLYAINTALDYQKLKLNLNIYSEQDGKTPATENAFTPAEEAAFLAAGDNVEDIFVQPAIDTIAMFDEFRIHYELIDTIVAGVLYEDILVYTINPEVTLFNANFTQVAMGEGDYILVPPAELAANGRVFRWVAPDSLTGLSQGNYISARRLVAPQQKQLFTLGGEYQVSKQGIVKAEVGLSNFDPNRFSTQNSGNNRGLSAFTNYQQIINLGKKEKGWQMETEVSYEFVEDNFKFINPYRDAEFSRDWSYDNTRAATEHLGRGGVTFRKKGLGNFSYVFGNFVRDSIYQGIQHTANFNLNQSGFDIKGNGSYLESKSDLDQTTFFRPRLAISKTFSKLKNWKLGVYGEREHNERYLSNTDTLQKNSFYYDLYRVFIESPSNDKWNIRTQYSQRYDYAPVEQDFLSSTIADEVQITGLWNASRNSRLNWNFTYRTLEIIDEDLSNQDPQETYLGRLDYLLNLWKGALRSNTSYEIGSGQEPKIEYNYLEVNAGEGLYQWKDYNGDGATQINEFEIAVFQDSANYIRTSIFTDDFIRSNKVQLDQSLRLSPKAIWFQKKGALKFFSRFSSQSTLRITRKTREDDQVDIYNPFQFNLPDSSLVSTTSNIRNTLFFNRADPKYSVELGISNLRNRVILTTGYESRLNTEQFLRTRLNLNRQIGVQLNGSIGIRANDSEVFNNKDYEIEFQKIEPKITWQPSTKFRTILAYEFSNSKNILADGGETAVNNDINLEATFNQSSTTSIRLKTSYVQVDFQGEPNSPVGFAMLQGLQNGQNYLWNIGIDRKLTQNIQLRLTYEGRKTGDARVVHVGRAQVAAVF